MTLSARPATTTFPTPRPCAVGRGFRDQACVHYEDCLVSASAWPGMTCGDCPLASPDLVDVSAVADRLPAWQAFQHLERAPQPGRGDRILQTVAAAGPKGWDAVVVSSCPRCGVPVGAGLCPCHVMPHPFVSGTLQNDAGTWLTKLGLTLTGSADTVFCSADACYRLPAPNRNGLCGRCYRAALDAKALPCSVDLCGRPARCGGLCHPCDQRQRRAARQGQR